MADVFSNSLRLREQESGSNAGNWGGLLNTTIRNIASAFGQGSETIPNASTHTITLADGVADEARSLYLKCTGGGQACTVTLGPNTISKVWIIDNATSYTLTFSQGSGANVAIAAGAVKVIATDGAGSGAAVTDALSGLEGSLSTLALTGALTGTSATFTVADNSDNLSLISTDTDDNSGPNLRMYRNSGSPGDNYVLGQIDFEGKNDAAQDVRYGFISAKISDASDGTEDGQLRFFTIAGGTETQTMTLESGNVGIGGAAHASDALNITSTNQHIRFNNGSELGILALTSDGDLDFWAHGADEKINFRTGTGSGTVAMNIVGTKVGIGTTSIHDFGTNNSEFQINGVKGGSVAFSRGTNGATEQYSLRTSDDDALRFERGSNYASETMRLTSAGDMYFASSSGNQADVGHIMQANGAMFHTMQDGPPLRLRRNTSDGVVIEISKDGNSCGHVGTHSGDEIFFGNSSNIGMRTEQTGADRFEPCTGTGASRNNAIDLGIAGNQFRQVFCQLVTESSDRNLKQDIQELTDSEQRVAVRAKSLLRKYRLISDVEDGDNRYSVGIIAQDLQDAFTAEGLDAANYKMWRSDTFIDEATGQEKTQQSIVYTQLLAFIISAL